MWFVKANHLVYIEPKWNEKRNSADCHHSYFHRSMILAGDVYQQHFLENRGERTTRKDNLLAWTWFNLHKVLSRLRLLVDILRSIQRLQCSIRLAPRLGSQYFTFGNTRRWNESQCIWKSKNRCSAYIVILKMFSQSNYIY